MVTFTFPDDFDAEWDFRVGRALIEVGWRRAMRELKRRGLPEPERQDHFVRLEGIKGGYAAFACSSWVGGMIRTYEVQVSNHGHWEVWGADGSWSHAGKVDRIGVNPEAIREALAVEWEEAKKGGPLCPTL